MMLVRNEGWTVTKVSDHALRLDGVFIHDSRFNHTGIMTVVNETMFSKDSPSMVKEGTFEMVYKDSKVYLPVTASYITIGFKLKEGAERDES